MALDPRRTTATISFLLVSIASAYFLQTVFIRSDHEKAQRIARTWSAGGDPLETVLVKRHPGASVAWRSEITSGCYGTARVSGLVVPPGGAAAIEHLFDVDIPRLRVQGLNAAAEAALAAVAASGRPPAAGGTDAGAVP